MKVLYALTLLPSLLIAQPPVQDERSRVAKEQQEIAIIQPPAAAPRSTISLPQPPVRREFPREEQRGRPFPNQPPMPIQRRPVEIPWGTQTSMICYNSSVMRNTQPLRNNKRRMQINRQNLTPKQREQIRIAREDFRREVQRILRNP